MNYLGHAYLSFGNACILTGNMIADHVKGKLALENYPPEIKAGILLHRKIDTFCDTHAVINRAKVFFRADYGLYAGAITDVIFDHFIANDILLFPTEKSLQHFAQTTYAQLSVNSAYFPEPFKNYFPRMVQHDWLSGYRKVKSIEYALTGLARRAKHMPPPDKAFSIFITHYFELNQRYDEFMHDLRNAFGFTPAT